MITRGMQWSVLKQGFMCCCMIGTMSIPGLKLEMVLLMIGLLGKKDFRVPSNKRRVLDSSVLLSSILILFEM